MPGDLHAPHVDARAVFPADVLHRTARYDGFLRWLWVAATLVTLAALALFVYLGPRIARAWELGRVATGVMVGAVTTLGVWAVGLPFGALQLWWGRRYGLERQGYARVGARAVAGAPRPGGRADDRAHRSAAARRTLRPALVARRRAAVRRGRRVARARAAVGRDARHAAAARHARRRAHPPAGQGGGRRRHAGPDRGRPRRDDGCERDGDRDRPLGARLHLGHVPRRPLLEPGDRGGRRARVRAHRPPPHLEGPRLVAAADRAGRSGWWSGDAPARRARAAGGRAARAARARADRPRRSRRSGTSSRAATRPRPTGRRCGRRTTRPRRRASSASSPATTWCSRTRRSGRTSGSTTTRRSCSGSRWPAPTRRAGAKSRCRAASRGGS